MRGVLPSVVILSLLTLPMSLVAATHDVPGETHRFEWDTRAHLDDTVVRLSLTLHEDGRCRFAFGLGGTLQDKGGPVMFYRVETEQEYVTGASVSVYDSHAVHYHHVDTRGPIDVVGNATLFPTGAFAASGHSEGPFAAGEYTYTLGGLGLHSRTDDPERNGYHSLRIEVDCDGAFTIDAFHGSHELMLFNAHTMEGGVGVYESLVVHAALVNHVEKRFESAAVESRVQWREYQEHGHVIGTLTRETPDGRTRYDLADPAEVTIRDTTGPGLHEYTLNRRVALDFFTSFSGLVYGLDPLLDLDAVVP